MPKIFVDTNIFLDFYRTQKEPIKVLEELLLHSGHILFPTQILNEIQRNRISILKQIEKSYKNNKPTFSPTYLLHKSVNYQQLTDLINTVKTTNEKVTNEIREIIEDPTKDEILRKIYEIFHSTEITKIEVTDNIIKKANKRKLLGIPPYSDKYTICDEVIWESILSYSTDDLIIVTRDKVYKDNISFFSDEYNQITAKKILGIEKKISSALKMIGESIPDAIEELEDRQIVEAYKHDDEFGIWESVMNKDGERIRVDIASFDYNKLCVTCQTYESIDLTGRCTICGSMNCD